MATLWEGKQVEIVMPDFGGLFAVLQRRTVQSICDVKRIGRGCRVNNTCVNSAEQYGQYVDMLQMEDGR